MGVKFIKALLKYLGRRLFQACLQQPGRIPETYWGLTYKDQALSLHGVRLQSLLEQFGTPLHVVNLPRLEQKLASFMQSHAELKTEVYYSYKTNPLPAMLKHLHQNGAGAEVISPFELWLALQLGVPADRIIYNGPGKSDASIEIAIDKEILLYNFNHPEEIPRVKNLLRRSQKTLRVGVRVITAGSWSGQLGCTMNEAITCYRELLNCSQFDVCGLHCHQGFLLRSEQDLEHYLSEILGFLDRLHRELAWLPRFLDLGGSLAVPTVRPLRAWEQRLAQTFLIEPAAADPSKTLSIEAYCKQMLQQIADFYRQRQQALPRIFLEPGRALSGSSQFLLTQVISTRQLAGLNYAIVDGGTAIADPIKSEFHQLFPLQRKELEKKPYRIVGPICHMGDVLYQISYLPTLESGDCLAIMDSGAYFLAEDRSFSFPRPGVVAVDGNGELHVMRRQQSFSDIVHRDFIDYK